MSEQHPQIYEPHLDLILSGELTVKSSLESMLRNLLVVRRRYNDPTQPIGTNCMGVLGGVVYSNRWSEASQKARVEAGIAFLIPKVGNSVGEYPPFPPIDARSFFIEKDVMGNFIPPK